MRPAFALYRKARTMHAPRTHQPIPVLHGQTHRSQFPSTCDLFTNPYGHGSKRFITSFSLPEESSEQTDDAIVADMLAKHGSQAQQERYVDNLRDGTMHAILNVTQSRTEVPADIAVAIFVNGEVVVRIYLHARRLWTNRATNPPFSIAVTTFSLSDPHLLLYPDITSWARDADTIGIIDLAASEKVGSDVSEYLCNGCATAMNWYAVDIPIENIVGDVGGIGRGHEMTRSGAVTK